MTGRVRDKKERERQGVREVREKERWRELNDDGMKREVRAKIHLENN